LAKESIPMTSLANDVIGKRLGIFHQELFNRAKKRLEKQWFKGTKLKDFAQELENKGGFYQTGWCRSELCETQLKEYKATIRCLLKSAEFKSCFACNKVSVSDILVARAY
jgi:prolyl-tRNA synthetase